VSTESLQDYRRAAGPLTRKHAQLSWSRASYLQPSANSAHFDLDLPEERRVDQIIQMDNLHEYNGWKLVVVVAVFLPLTCTSVILRCFVRIGIAKSFQMDDYLMLAAQSVFTIFCSFLLAGVHFGLGQHNADIPEQPRTEALKVFPQASLSSNIF